MKNATASPAYSAEQMQDIRRRLLRAEEQRDAKAAALDVLVEAAKSAALVMDAEGLHSAASLLSRAIADAVAVQSDTLTAAKAAQVSK